MCTAYTLHTHMCMHVRNAQTRAPPTYSTHFILHPCAHRLVGLLCFCCWTIGLVSSVSLAPAAPGKDLNPDAASACYNSWPSKHRQNSNDISERLSHILRDFERINTCLASRAEKSREQSLGVLRDSAAPHHPASPHMRQALALGILFTCRPAKARPPVSSSSAPVLVRKGTCKISCGFLRCSAD